MEKQIINKSPTNDEVNAQKQGKINRFITFISGLIVGMLLICIVGWIAMPSMMLVVHQSRYDTVEETCKQLKVAIEANGWRSPAIRNMNKDMAKHGVLMDRKVRIVELCNATYAKDILSTNPEVSTLIPCAWVYTRGMMARFTFQE